MKKRKDLVPEPHTMIVNLLLMKVTLFFSSCQTVDDFFAVNGMAQEKCWKQEKRGLQETEHPQKKHGVQTFAKFS